MKIQLRGQVTRGATRQPAEAPEYGRAAPSDCVLVSRGADHNNKSNLRRLSTIYPFSGTRSVSRPPRISLGLLLLGSWCIFLSTLGTGANRAVSRVNVLRCWCRILCSRPLIALLRHCLPLR
jgi:hypothetical protein